MPSALQLISYDDLYHRITSDKVLINQIDPLSAQNKELIDAMAMKNYAQDNLSLIPSCQCGCTTGTYYVGTVCHLCNTKVVNGLDDPISFLLWVQKPQGVELFISPAMMRILVLRYTIGRPKVSLIEHILIPTYRATMAKSMSNMMTIEKLDHLLETHKIPKGYNSFVQNFYRIIELLETEILYTKETTDFTFMALLRENEKEIFSNYLPFPNKIVFASESNELGRFFDRALLSPINVIRRLSGIDLRTRPSAIKQVKVAKSLIEMGAFYEKYMKDYIFKKYGLVRQNIGSSRNHFTARAVIVSIQGAHRHDDLHLPWSVACTLFRPFLLNLLDKEGQMSYKEQVRFLTYHVRLHHPWIQQAFEKMIASTPGGIVALLSRNPLLHRGSIQRVCIVRIKNDPDDTTFSMSDRVGAGFNSDHDGRLHCRHYKLP